LDAVLGGIAALPVDLVIPAGREIAQAMRLGSWTQPKHSLFIRLFRQPFTEKHLLNINPKYAWIFLFNYDGRVRESALDAIEIPPPSPFLFSALAWRLNDWAFPVRQSAVRCAARVFEKTSTQIAAQSAIHLLPRISSWGRWGNERGCLDETFGRSDVIAAFVNLLSQSPTGPVSTCFRQSLRYPNIDKYLPHLAANAIQPSVRAAAYECLLARKASWPVGFEWEWIDKVYGLRRRVPTFESRLLQSGRAFADLVTDAIYDKSAFVKKVAADFLMGGRSDVPNADTLIAHLAKDKNSAVRARAEFMLRQQRNNSTN
jgi:hypothetical protein